MDEQLSKELDDLDEAKQILARLELAQEMLPYLVQTNPSGVLIAFIAWLLIPICKPLIRATIKFHEKEIERYRKDRNDTTSR